MNSLNTQHEGLDRISLGIIKELQENARISNRELAEKIFLSPSACLKRTRKLEEQGYIRHYTINLDLDRFTPNVMSIVHLRLESLTNGSAGEFEAAIAQRGCAVECYRVSGHFDYIIHFMCTSLAHYNDLIEELVALPFGIAEVSSHFVMSTPKPFRRYPLEELCWEPSQMLLESPQ